MYLIGNIVQHKISYLTTCILINELTLVRHIIKMNKNHLMLIFKITILF